MFRVTVCNNRRTAVRDQNELYQQSEENLQQEMFVAKRFWRYWLSNFTLFALESYSSWTKLVYSKDFSKGNIGSNEKMKKLIISNDPRDLMA